MTLEGNPWFVAKDVCELLGYKQSFSGGYSSHLQYHLDPSERKTVSKGATESFSGPSLFVVADVLKVIGIGNPSQAVKALDDDEKGIYNIYTPSGFAHHLFRVDVDEKRTLSRSDIHNDSMWGLFGKQVSVVSVVSESGLYKLVLRSRTPQALAFRDWVTKEVLPSIRKTGSYSHQQEDQPRTVSLTLGKGYTRQ